MNKEDGGTTITRALFRARVNAYALWGTGIALFAVIAGTLLVSVYQFGTVSPEAVMAVQTSNPALWLLNIMPFVFGLWGQLTGAMVMSRAGEMVMDQTRALSTRTLELEQVLRQNNNNRSQIRGLKSVSQFREMLQRDIRERGGSYDGIGVVAIDFNDFRDVRGLVGDSGLDAVVEAIAGRLQRTLRDSDMMAHVRDDRFIIALYDVGASGNYLPRVCRRIHRALHAPLEIGNARPVLTPRIGAVLYPRDADDGHSLMQLAESERKASPRGEVGYGIQRGGNDAADTRLADLFSQALDARELVLDYVPQTGADDGLLVYLRAHPCWPGQDNMIVDGSWLADLAGRSGHLEQYLLWLFDESFRSLRFWRERQDLMVGITIPVHTPVADKLPLAEMLNGLLERYRLSPAGVVLEFSGRALTAGGDSAEQTLAELRRSGFRVCLSGFGSEASSLQALLRLRPDEVRMSPEWLDDYAEVDVAMKLMSGLVRLAGRLGVGVVVPGVSDPQRIGQLAADGVQRVEGPAVGQAMPADRVGYWQQFGGQRRARGAG